jgi:Transposase domain (DUF772)
MTHHAEFADKTKITRREKFLTRMEALIPWTKLLAVIEPFYPQGQRGRPPIGLERMLRIYFLQQWYGLADEALEESQSLRPSLRRTSLPHPQEYFRASESALSGAGQKRASTLHAVWTGQRDHRRAAGHGMKNRTRAAKTD